MSEAPPDFKALARRYLDLWQEQVAAMANDPALAEAVARGVAMMSQAPAAFVQAATAGVQPTSEGQSDGPQATDSKPESGADRSPAVAAPPVQPCLDPGEFLGRLAALEGRVAELEARLGGQGGGAEAKPRRRRTRRVE
ncbi:MAG: hypothetical protein AB1918_06905 [Pseudomonadota bacterium]